MDSRPGVGAADGRRASGVRRDRAHPRKGRRRSTSRPRRRELATGEREAGHADGCRPLKIRPMTTGARADLVRVLVAHAGRGLGGRLPRPGVCRLGGIQLLQPNLELPPFPNDGRLALEELRPDLGKEQEVDISAGNEFLWAAELVHAPGALLSLQLGLESAALKNADLQHSPYRLPCDHRADGLHHAGGANAVNVNEAE
mmetsp:Transcript_7716/g.25304  ORF Transcript_7716/g.25304 Transcript_7716/m.25304 type:complete len:200 (-) Transcript_7716:438-1037(-)